MNDNNTATEPNEQVELSLEEVAEQKEKEQADAQSAFLAGFKNVRKDADPAPDPRADRVETEEAPVPKSEPKPEPAKAPDDSGKAAKKPAVKEAPKVEPVQSAEAKELEAMKQRMRNLEGSLGGFKDKFEKLTAQPAAKKSEQPTAQEVTKALMNPQEMERLVKEFPEFKPIVQGFNATSRELSDTQAKLNNLQSLVDKLQSSHKTVDEEALREQLRLDSLAPGWEEVTKTPEFFAFTLEGGPPEHEYLEQVRMEQTDPNTSMRMVNAWAQQYPQWWADKGYALFSTKAADSSKLINKFKEQSTQAAEQETRQQQDALRKSRNQQRLDRAKTPTGVGGAPEKGVSDSDAFRRGFQKVRR